MQAENLDNKARKIQDLANRLGWTSDINLLVKRTMEIDRGLVQEEEFIYILNWSGKCSLIHKLDQFIIPPSAKNNFTIPDIYVIFNNDGLETPFFIEIKTSQDDKLSWTEKYYNGLINYSKISGIPILIAWKWSALGIWTLFSIDHFVKSVSNYKIDLNKAHQENLMSKLAGDYFITLVEEFSIHFVFKKITLVKSENGIESWIMECESIYIKGFEGAEVHEIDDSILALLLSLNLEELVVESETHLTSTFRPLPNNSIYAQSIPIRLATIFSEHEINWQSKLRGQEFKIQYDNLYESLVKNIDKRLIRYIFHIIPLSDKS